MPEPTHVLIAYASLQAPGCQQRLPTLVLPQLQRLLARLSLAHSDCGAEDDYIPPHERALARALGLSHSAPPWAAWHSQNYEQACAYLTPCHWQASMDSVHMHAPELLQLDEAQSRTVQDIIAPWLAQDGITLHYEAPLRWRAHGEVFADLHSAALERVQGRDVRHWMPQGPHQRLLQRLHSEIQMLLYQHPLNDTRTAQGQSPVNAFWVHGAGQLAQPPAPCVPPPALHLDLRASALSEDWHTWAHTWQQLDAGPLARLAQQAAQGRHVTLTLCGERAALSWCTAPRALTQRVRHLWRPPCLATVSGPL